MMHINSHYWDCNTRINTSYQHCFILLFTAEYNTELHESITLLPLSWHYVSSIQGSMVSHLSQVEQSLLLHHCLLFSFLDAEEWAGLPFIHEVLAVQLQRDSCTLCPGQHSDCWDDEFNFSLLDSNQEARFPSLCSDENDCSKYLPVKPVTNNCTEYQNAFFRFLALCRKRSCCTFWYGVYIISK